MNAQEVKNFALDVEQCDTLGASPPYRQWEQRKRLLMGHLLVARKALTAAETSSDECSSFITDLDAIECNEDMIMEEFAELLYTIAAWAEGVEV